MTINQSSFTDVPNDNIRVSITPRPLLTKDAQTVISSHLVDCLNELLANKDYAAALEVLVSLENMDKNQRLVLIDHLIKEVGK